MPTKPGDNKLGKRDTRTLEAYRDKIDPEGKGVSFAKPSWSYYPARCVVCERNFTKANMREFWLKPAWSESDARYVCNSCCEKAQGAIKA